MEILEKNSSNSKILNISACIISNNDENLIENCIKSVKDFVKEIIIIDIGSKDSTLKIAQQYTNKIQKYKWNYDYSEVKNQFHKLSSTEWLLFLNAYENLAEESKSLFNNNFLNNQTIAYVGKDIQMFQDREIEVPSCRLLKKTNEIKFKGPIFESPYEDIQRISRLRGMKIEYINLNFNVNFYLKYIDDIEMYKEYLEIINNALDKKILDKNQRLAYSIYKAICLKYVGDIKDAEDLMLACLDEVKRFNKKESYNIPLFMQPFLFLGAKYSKENKYKEALEIVKEGVEIYPNSLTLLTRYCEVLYANNKYKEALDHVAKIIKLQRDDTYYPLEGINFNMVNKISQEIAKLAYDKYMNNLN
jgi:tetratricopeptide (TPR) repeat protein